MGKVLQELSATRTEETRTTTEALRKSNYLKKLLRSVKNLGGVFNWQENPCRKQNIERKFKHGQSKHIIHQGDKKDSITFWRSESLLARKDIGVIDFNRDRAVDGQLYPMAGVFEQGFL